MVRVQERTDLFYLLLRNDPNQLKLVQGHLLRFYKGSLSVGIGRKLLSCELALKRVLIINSFLRSDECELLEAESVSLIKPINVKVTFAPVFNFLVMQIGRAHV